MPRAILEGLGSDEALLDLRLVCQPELRLSQRLRPVPSGWTVDEAHCVLGDGLRFEGEVNPVVYHLLTLCRGDQPISAVSAPGRRAARPGSGGNPAGSVSKRYEAWSSRASSGPPGSVTIRPGASSRDHVNVRGMM